MGSIYRRQDGVWCGALLVCGRRKIVYGRTERMVRRKLAAVERQCAVSGRLPDPGRKTVADLLDAWLASCPDLKPRTRADYQDLARRYVLPTLGQVRLSRLDPSHLQHVYADLQAKGLRRAPAHVHALLHRALHVATLWGWLPANPADRVMAPKYAAPRRDVWTAEQLRLFLDAGAPHWLHPLWVLLVATGCRLGELLALRWDDANLEARTITVRRGMQRIHGAWVETDPKTRAGNRTLSLPPQAVAALHRQRVQQAEWRLRAGATWQASDLVFTAPTRGGPLLANTVQPAMQRLVRRLGLPPLSPHGLRHQHTSVLLDAEVPVPEVSARLGHANPGITMRVYAHKIGRHDERAAAVMGAMLDNLRAGR